MSIDFENVKTHIIQINIFVRDYLHANQNNIKKNHFGYLPLKFPKLGRCDSLRSIVQYIEELVICHKPGRRAGQNLVLASAAEHISLSDHFARD